jgi:PAS domain S-box-containing protein
MSSAPYQRSHPPEETLDELYENAPCGYLTLDSEGAVVRANATILHWLGHAVDGLIGKRIQEILTPAGRIFFETHVAPLLLSEGVAPQVAVDLRCVDGRRLPVLGDWRRVTSGANMLGTRVMLIDASDRRSYERDLVAARERAEDVARQLRRSEARLLEMNETLEARVAERTAELERAHEQLRQSQKLEAMGTLTGGVAHDFNNLLTPIIGGLDLLQRKNIGDERAQRMIAGALTSAERAKTLVQRLLAFARRQPLQPVPVDLVALVHGMTELLASTCGPQIRLEIDAADDLLCALAEANQIEMALLNLTVNARDAMPGGGTLTISVEAASDANGGSDRQLRLSVRDTGFGMDEETRARAVEPFFSTKGIGKGTGLGLSMIHGLAAQLGGRLDIQSRLGEGTQIDLWLPSIERAAVTEVVGDQAGNGGVALGTVLLVDDEEPIRATIFEMLQDLGYRVIEVDTGHEALALIEGGLAPDLLVTDHLMPGMTGTELARQVLTHTALPILIISGYADVDSIPSDLARLPKPFRQLDLTEALAKILP